MNTINTNTPTPSIPLQAFILARLEDYKAKDTVLLDVQKISSICSAMIVTTVTSGRHALATAKKLFTDLKQNGYAVYSVEGEANPDWMLLDAGSVIVHLMQPSARDYYQLEKLWRPTANASD